MTPATELFELIKSLKQTEKRYFKVFASRLTEGKQPEYLLLFNSIDAMSEYDEGALKEKLKGRAFVKQLHVAKNYLTGVILQSLAAYYHGSSAQNTIAHLLQTIEILYDKHQHNLCMRQIEKGIRLCKKYNKHPQLFIFLDWQSKIFIRRQQYTEVQESIQQQQTILSQLSRYLQAKQSAVDIHRQFSSQGFPRTTAETKAIEQKLLNFEIEENSTVEEEYYRLFALSSFYAGAGQHKKRAEIMEKLVSTLRKNEDYITEHPNIYTSALNNCYNALIGAGQTDKAQKIWHSIQQWSGKINVRRQDARIFTQMIAYDIELELALLTNKGAQVINHLGQIKSFLEANGGVFQRTNTQELIYNAARVCFAQGNYTEALDWLNQLLNQPASLTRQDLRSACSILFLLIQYEQGNSVLLKNMITSTRNSLKYKRRLYAAEQLVLSALQKLNGTVIANNKKQLLAQLLSDIKKLPDHYEEAPPAIMVDVAAWADSRVTGLPMGECMAQLYKQQTVSAD